MFRVVILVLVVVFLFVLVVVFLFVLVVAVVRQVDTEEMESWLNVRGRQNGVARKQSGSMQEKAESLS